MEKNGGLFTNLTISILAGDVAQVKSMKKPPGGVRLVMEAVCVLRSLKPERVKDPSGSGKMVDDYWPTSQKMMADTDFKKKLLEFDKVRNVEIVTTWGTFT